MGNKCIGCGKPMGGMLGAYGVRLLYGEVCLTCNKKLNVIPNYQFLTPSQMKDILSGELKKEDVKVSSNFVSPGDAPPNQSSSADEIRKYKGLLDEGIITQEEFEAVKKRIMNI